MVKGARLLAASIIVVWLAAELFAQTTLRITTASLSGGIVGATYLTETLTATGGTAPYAWTPTSGVLPSGLTLSSNGTISGTPTATGTFTFTVRATDSAATPQTAVATLSILVKTPLSVATVSLPNGAVDASYAQTLTASGGTMPYTWSLFSGSLPDGLELSRTGAIGGTPSSLGTFNFTLSVFDNTIPLQTASKPFVITIQPKLVITTSELPIGVVGVFYSRQLASAGPTSVSWSVASGNLPPGITLSGNGNLAGTPTFAGTFDSTIQVSGGDQVQNAQQNFRIVINPALTITTAATLPDAALSVPYTVRLNAAGGVPPYTWNSQARLPSGLTLSSSGLLSGTPTGLGALSMAVQVSDSFSPQQVSERIFTLTVASPLTITNVTLPSGFQNVAYSQQLQAIGGTAPYTWVVASGTLPSGLSLTAGGLLQGTPTAVASSNLVITVTDSRGATATRNLSVVIDSPLSTLSAPTLPTNSTPTQQLTLGLSLSASHPSPLSGRLTLSFASRAEIAADDPMTQFSTGSRSVSFTIPANTTDAVFPSPLMLLLGTVAGTVRLKASIDNGPSDLDVATVDILVSPPQMTQVKALRTVAGVDVLITGYSSARRVTSVEFGFDLKKGSKTHHFTLTRNVDALFASWYQSVPSVAYGSAFSFTQSFTIQEAGTAIEAVTVTLKNAQGSTSSSLIHPQ